jgi:iron(III) transport system ATP-binding protein
VTTVLVTHDQEEALSLADTVAVLRDGRIIQQDAPARLYERPADEPLARFLGAVNLIDARFERGSAHTTLGVLELREAGGGQEAGTGRVLLRPEQLAVHAHEGATGGLSGHVEQCRYYGHDALLHIRPDEPRDAPLLLARVPGGQALAVGTRVTVAAHGTATALERAGAQIS